MPLLSLLFTLLYLPLFHLGITFAEHSNSLSWLFTWVFSGAPAAATAVLVGAFLFKLKNDVKESLIFALLFFFCTLYLSYSVFLSHHLLAGFLITAAFYILWFHKDKSLFLLLAGLSCGSAIFIDPPPGAAFSAAFFFYLLLSRTPLFRIAFFALAASLPVIANSIASLSAFGTLMPPNIDPQYFQYYGAAFDESNLSGAVMNNSLRLLLPYAFHCLIGYRGLFSYTPLLFFALWGGLEAYKSRQRRGLLFAAIISAVIFTAYYFWRTNNLGGDSYGIRFLLPIVPLLFIMLAFVWERIKTHRIRRWFTIAAIWSFIVALVGLYRPASDADLGINSFAANLFHFQTYAFPSLSRFTWKPLAALSGYDPNITAFIGETMLTAGALEPARDALNSARDADSSNFRANINLGNIAFKSAVQRTDYDAAIRFFRAANPHLHPQLLLSLAATFQAQGESDSSNLCVNRYLALGDSITPTIPQPLVAAGLGFYSHSAKDKALALLTENYLTKNLLDSARSALEQMSPDFLKIESAVLVKTKFLLRSGDHQSALQLLQNAAPINPGLRRSVLADPELSLLENEIKWNEESGR